MSATVLLTGISGFIGLYCAKELLEQGFKVRGTVRSKQRENHALEALKIGNVNITNLDFAILDLTTDDGWNNAMEGCEYVLHVASPFRIANPKNANEMMLPAVEGTKRILRAASEANVKRVVLTSSIVSMMSSIRRGQFGPDDWRSTRPVCERRATRHDLRPATFLCEGKAGHGRIPRQSLAVLH